MKQARAEEQPLQVLVVDDSAVVRQIMGAVLSGSGPFDVTTASDPLIAMEKMKRVRPGIWLLVTPQTFQGRVGERPKVESRRREMKRATIHLVVRSPTDS